MPRFPRSFALYFLIIVTSLASVFSEPTSAHDAPMTGVTVEINGDSTHVVVKTHRANLPVTYGSDDIARALHLSVDGHPFQPVNQHISLDPSNQIVTWTCDSPGAAYRVTVETPLFPDRDSDRTVVTMFRDGQIVGGAVLTPGSPAASLGETTSGLLLRFLLEGMHHIYSGTDHLAFLFALLLPVARIRDIAKVVTAFTVAHSLTLTIAVLGVVSIPYPIVEPAIAVSILAAAAENLLPHRAEINVRILYAFFFGLIHGFGFASALAEAGLPHHALAAALFSFNAGVEVAQLSIVLTFVPLLELLRNWKPIFHVGIVRYASLAIVAVGAFWTIQRIAFR